MFSIQVALLATLTLATPALAVLPAHNAPPNMHSFDVDGGGRVLQGALPQATSGAQAFEASLSGARAYFDAPVQVVRVVRSKDKRVTIAAFDAALDGERVTGLDITTYDPAGNSHVDLLFDHPEMLRETISTMAVRMNDEEDELLERMRPVDGFDFAKWERASRRVSLRHMDFADGAGSIGIAEDFSPQLMHDGAFMAASAEGAYIRLSTPIRFVDPNVAGRVRKPDDFELPYQPDPIAAWKEYLTENAEKGGGTDPSPQVMHSARIADNGRLVDGTITIQGARFVFTGAIVESSAPGMDGVWYLNITLLAAPHDTVDQDMPQMIAMLRSERLNKRPDISQVNKKSLVWMTVTREIDSGRMARYKQSKHNAESARNLIDPALAAIAGKLGDNASWKSAFAAVDRRHFDVIHSLNVK